MNTIQIKKIIAATIFMITIICFLVVNLCFSYSDIINTSDNADISSLQDVNTLEKSIESTMEDKMLFRYNFIEGFGVYQDILSKHEYNNFKYVKDKDGFIYFGSVIDYDNTESIKKLAIAVKNFKEKYSNINVIVATPPDRFYDNKINGYIGLPYSNTSKDIDKYYNFLNDIGIDTFDYRNMLCSSGYSKEDLYYKTDHHWKTITSFLAFKEFVNVLNTKYNEKLDENNYYSDINNYQSIKYKDRFVGSFGRETGYMYSGIDDYEILIPRFSTSYIFNKENIDGSKKVTNGSFEDTLINKAILSINSKPYLQDVYSAYCDGVLYPLGQITNLNNKDKPKVLLIRDSYSSSFAAFLSTVCSEVDLYYPNYEYDIDKLIKEKNYDYVVFSGYSGTFGSIYDNFVNKYY